jgi:hypothetical protein
MPMTVSPEQQAICDRFGAEPHPVAAWLNVGIGGADDGIIHGVRHPPEGDTTGWYIWRGDYSEASDFFRPLHVEHLDECVPQALPYLALPRGWRFLLAPGHEDVWQDDSLLNV